MAFDPTNHCDVGQSLISLEQALVELKSRAKIIEKSEKVQLNSALGRVLAEDIVSNINVPPADNSAMDGYALLATDLTEDQNEFLVSQRICAGEVGEKLKPNTVARIFTGAPIPVGADAVLMQENCEYQQTSNTVVIKQSSLVSGANVRKAGEDIKEGAMVLHAGQKLRAQDIGLAASVGIAELSVKRRLKVAVFFTGDELCDPGNTPKAGQIYNSNRYTLTGLLNSLGCEVIDLGNVEDTLATTIKTMQSAAEQADLVMTSGGVSVGEEDHIRKALEQLGELNMWRVNIKPGKPFAFGQINTTAKQTPFIGLPGNPVSVFATFCIFCHPYILQTQGASNTQAKSYKVASGFELDGSESRNEYLRVRHQINQHGDASLSLYPNQSSGVLTSASWGNGFAFIPANTVVQLGDLITFTPFSEFSIA